MEDMNLIPTEQNHNSKHLVSTQENNQGQELIQTTDAKYQEIFYWKGSTRDRIPNNPNKLKPIDLQNALNEIMNLRYAEVPYKDNMPYSWIVFYNQKNMNSIDILRLKEDLWNLATPVWCDDPICASRHIAQSDTKRLEDVIKMFFEGDDWYGMVNFRFDHETYELLLSMGY